MESRSEERKESFLCVSRGNYRCRFALPLATWLNSFPSSLCPSLVPLGSQRQNCMSVCYCVCVCMNVEGGKSGNLHNKLGKKRGEKKSMQKRKMVFVCHKFKGS